MSIRVAINGVGRIGRALVRVAAERPEISLVAVNDVASTDQLATLLARDTLYGLFPGDVASDHDALLIDGCRIATTHEPDPGQIDWSKSGAQIVVDATGLCTQRRLAEQHLRGTIRKVLVSANAADLDLTICLGVNQNDYDPAHHHLLSASSCTTNCLAPMLAVLDRHFGLRQCLFNTVHSYNNDQRLLSFPHADPRRAREAALNMIPTTTSATQAIHRVIPGLSGRIDGFAVRVPTPNVSLIDLVARLDDKPPLEDVRTAFRTAATQDLAGILAVSEQELVSMDFLGNPHSAIIDLPLTQCVDDGMYRIVAWYDNEWGHASRLVDLVLLIGESLSDEVPQSLNFEESTT